VSPPRPPRTERPPTPEGENGQNTTLFECATGAQAGAFTIAMKPRTSAAGSA